MTGVLTRPRDRSSGWVVRVVLFAAVVCIVGLGAMGAVGAATAFDSGSAPAETETKIDNESRIAPTQFETAAGDVLWEAEESLSPSSATVVVDGILVTTTGSGTDAGVTAYDVGTGEQRWAVDIPANDAPTVVDGTVYVTSADGVWALELERGAIEWHHEFDTTEDRATTQSVGDGAVFTVEPVNASTDRLVALDAETGDTNWETAVDRLEAGPTVVDGEVYAIDRSELLAFDASDGELAWEWSADAVIDSAREPTVADDLVYVSHTAGDDDPGIVSAIERGTGETEWETELGVVQEALTTIPTAPTVSGDGNESTVYVGYDQLYALDAAGGSERWTDGDAVFDPPTVADDTLFVPQTTESDAFRALNVSDGSEQWSVETGDRSRVIVVDGVAYVAVETGDERLMAIDAGVEGSSSDSSVMLGGQNHHHAWTGEIPVVEPQVVDATFDEGVFIEDELTVSATVRNDWNPSTSATYTLELDGDPQVSQTIDVPAYGTNTVELPMTAPDTPGEYTLTIGDEEIGTLTVVDETDPVFRSVNPFFDTRLEGDLIQIPYEATNLGDESVEENATLALEGPAFDGREDVAFAGPGEGINPGDTILAVFVTDPIDEPGEYTAFIEDVEIGNITVLPEDEPIYLTDTNRLHDSIISGIEAPVEPSAAGEASVDVRYENLGESQGSVESELIAYKDEKEIASVTETLDVDGNSSATERLSIPLAEPGVYDLEVDGEPVGEVEVLVDGVQDGDSIQEAIDAALPGDEVVVGDGTYEESLTIDKELTLRTVSDGGAVLDGSGDRFERAITVTEDDVTVEGFRIEGYTGSGLEDAAVVVGGERFTFSNNMITSSNDGIQVEFSGNADELQITDNDIQGNIGDGVVNRADDITVLRNTITDNGGAGIDLGNGNDRFTIDANEIHRNEVGITYNQNGGDDGAVTNNSVTQNSETGIELGTFGSDNLIRNNTVTGNDDGIKVGTDEVRDNHVSAPDGFAIEVRGSSTVANNTITDATVGVGPSVGELSGTIIDNNTFEDVSRAISRGGDDIIVHNNEFSETKADVVLGDATGATITNNTFATGVNLDGVPEEIDQEPHEMSENTVGGDPLVYVVGEESPEITPDAGQIILINVTDVDLDEYSFSDVTAAIQVAHSENIQVTGLELSDVPPSGITDINNPSAVKFWYSSDVTIDEFELTGTNRGLYVEDSDNVTISNGQVSNGEDVTGSRAIMLAGTNADVVIEDNDIFRGQGSLGTGIDLSESDVLSVTGNTIQGASTGIALNRATNATMADNIVEDATTTGVRFGQQFPAAPADISDIDFVNNTVTGGDEDGVIVDRGALTGNVTVTENTITETGLTTSPAPDPIALDLTIDDGETVVIGNNAVTNNEGEIGSTLDIEADVVTIIDNFVTQNDVGTGFEINLNTPDGTVASNTVSNNGDGLVMTGETATDVTATITENILEDNTGAGLTIGGFYEEFLVTKNSIEGNEDGLFYDPGDAYVLNATNNWWGNASGPSGGVIDNQTRTVADGGGDSITVGDDWWVTEDSVRFDPWLDAPIFDTGRLSGTVTDADTGDPLADASVEVLDGSAVIDSAKTDADGTYELTLPTGTYDVAANADGYEEALEEGVAIDGEEETTANLTLAPTQDGSIEGTVIDAESGDPIASAAIEIVEQEGVGEPPAVDGSTTTVETNEDGEFTADVPPGVYEYTVSKAGFDEAGGTDVEVSSGEPSDVGTIELTAFPVVTGTVTDTVTGESIEGVSIESSAIGATEAFDTAETNATGEYVITIPKELAQLEFTSPGYLPKEVSVDGQDIDGTDQVDVELTLEDDLGTVTGTVTRESTGETVQGAMVIATDEDDTQVDVDITDGDGVYGLQVEPGTYTITATEEATLPESGTVENVEVSAGEQKTMDIELEPIDFLPPSNVSVAIDEGESVTDVTEGEDITVVADITNTGDEQIDQEVLFGVFDQEAGDDGRLEGEPRAVNSDTNGATDDGVLYESDPKAVTIEPEETERVSFSVESERDFDNTTGIVVSGEPGADEAAAFDVIGLSVSPLDPDPKSELSFTDQEVVDGSVLVEDVTTEQESTILVTYEDNGLNVTAGLASVDILDSADVQVMLEDDGGLPGEHTAWLFADGDLPGDVGIGDDVTPIAGDALASERASLTEEPEEDPTPPPAPSPPPTPDPEPDFEVLEASVEPLEVTIGGEATIEAMIENVGDGDGDVTVPFEVNGELIEETTLSLDAGEQTNVTFTYTFEAAGAFQMTVDGVDAGTVTVLEDDDADVIIYGADVNQSSVVLGETVQITGDLLNTGGAGSDTVDLNVDGERIESTTVDVGPGATPGAVAFEWTPTEADLPADADEMDATISLNGFVVDTVHIENQYSDIQVIAASASESELVEGEELYVVGSTYQAGTIDGPEEIELTATNIETGESEVVGTQEVTLSPGFYHLGAVNISHVPDAAGTYDLELGDRSAGTVEVEAAESDVQVIAASSSEIELIEDEQAYVVGSLYQAGNIEGTEEIELTATNTDTGESEVLGTQEVTLSPGFYHLGGLNVSYSLEEASTYELELGDRSAGTIEVEPAASDMQVIAASNSRTEMVTGEESYVVGSIYQNGNTEGPEEIELTATNTDTGESEVVGTQEVTLSPGFYHLGALNVTYTPEEAGTYELTLGEQTAGTIEVEAAESDIEVIAASPSEINVLENEELYVVGSIYQAGNIEGTEEVDLTATNTDTGESEVLGSQEVTLDAGFYHLGAINITAEFDEAGTYELELGDRSAGTIEVEPRNADIQVIAASASEVEVIEGEELYVVGSVHNQGDDEGTEEIELTATNTETNETAVLGSQEVTLESGFYHLGAINITAEFDEAGTYDLTLGERDAGLVAVEEAITDITVVAASAGDLELVAGEESYVVGSIYQNGTVEETEEIELTATNTETNETEVLGSQEVTLSPGVYHLGALNISYTPEEAGTYELELGDRSAGTIEVEPAVSDIQVIAASNSRVEMIAGEESYVVGSIYQAGNIGGTEEIDLTATNTDTGESEVVGTQEVTLDAGFYHLGAVNITFAPEEAGTYELALGEQTAGTIEVEPAESDIQVIAASSSEIELVEDEQAYVVGSIYQAGNIEGTEEVDLTATNTDTGESEALGSQEVTLDAGFYHLGGLNVSYSLEEAGTYELELGDRSAGTIEVEPAASDMQVIAASNSRVEMVTGEESYVVGSLYQGGNIEGPEEIELTATNTDTGESEVVGTQEVTLSPGFYHLGAVNISYSPEEAGTYELTLGDRTAGTVEVGEPSVDLSTVNIEGYSEAYDPDTEAEQVYASEDATVSVDIDADLDLETVTVLASSLETNYVRSVEASHESGETWTAAVPFADIQDDGRYELSVVAVDAIGTAGTATADTPLVIDREDPRLSATLEDVDGESATVVVESDTPLDEPPEVEGTFSDPDGETQTGSVSMLATDGTDTRFTGSFATGETGSYEITSVGTDRAGNTGTDTVSASVDTRFTLGDGVIELEDSGTSIEFDVADGADEAVLTQDLFVSLSETTANANLEDGDLGAGFITADLDNLLDYYLDEGSVESATITMAVDESDLPASVAPDDAVVHYYDSSADAWEPVAGATTIQIGDDTFATASVTSFSTYGVLIPDTEPPTITDQSPANGDTLESGLKQTTVTVDYEDDHSGVDVGSVTIEINGEDVTESDETTITSSGVEHHLTLEPGASYTTVVTVTDRSDNTATAESTFDVATPDGEADEEEDDDEQRDDHVGDDERVDDSSDDAIPAVGLLGGLLSLVIACSLLVAYNRTRQDTT